jgi:hypothetical protein
MLFSLLTVIALLAHRDKSIKTVLGRRGAGCFLPQHNHPVRIAAPWSGAPYTPEGLTTFSTPPASAPDYEA